jgi:hypothetical protein
MEIVQMNTDVSEEHAPSTLNVFQSFSPADAGSMILRNFEIHLQENNLKN